MSNQFIYVPFKSRGELSAISADISSDNDISSFVNNKITAMSVDARLATLSSNIMTAVEEMSTTIELSTLDSYDASYNISALYPLSDHNTGDIAIIKKPISADVYEYATYVADKKLSVWTPMTGKYAAENVYMTSNLIITKDFGYHTVNASKGYSEISCKGQTIQKFLEDSFKKSDAGTTTPPSFSITKSNYSGEYGKTMNIGSGDVKLMMNSIGSYTYDPKTATGVSVAVGAAKIGIKTSTGALSSISSSVSKATASNSTLVSPNYSGYGYKLSSTVNKYILSAEVTYSDGVVPKNNLGIDTPSAKITGATSVLTAEVSFTGYQPAYYVFTDTFTNQVPSNISANGSGDISWKFSDTKTFTLKRDTLNGSFNKSSFTPSYKWYELYYIIPSGKHTSWTGTDPNNMTLPVEPKETITFTYVDGTTANYDVFIVRNKGLYDAVTCSMTFK